MGSPEIAFTVPPPPPPTPSPPPPLPSPPRRERPHNQSRNSWLPHIQIFNQLFLQYHYRSVTVRKIVIMSVRKNGIRNSDIILEGLISDIVDKKSSYEINIQRLYCIALYTMYIYRLPE